jgi:hypothetical protein
MTDEDRVLLLGIVRGYFERKVPDCDYLRSGYPDLDGVDINAADARYNLDSTGHKVLQNPTEPGTDGASLWLRRLV